MIGFLKGRIIHIEGSEITLKCGGVGYNIQIGENSLRRLNFKIGGDWEFIIHTLVKEDDIILFGFMSHLDKKVFKKLLTVTGVGPKASLKIVDNLSGIRVVMSILSSDIEAFKGVPGIGKKKAENIISSLKNKMEEFQKKENQ